MLTLKPSAEFDRDLKRLARRGKNIVKLINIIIQLAAEMPLPPNCRDHPLKGDLEGFRDCHVEPDWILVYAVSNGKLILSRTGTHDDVLGE